MKNNDLIFCINKSSNGVKTASINISPLLSENDYKAWWAGENGDSGYETEKVENLRNLLEDYVQEGNWLDFQIWEKGNAWVKGIDTNKLSNLVKAIEVFDNDTYELVEQM